ncbi:hypothetical protein D187_007317 [Cystobacter fuscus DSM 2262]|uniref:Uncharacterized protein n=1 Tax=Cystobacter fuscus (strain ATCC 25194 / DSM 2262 / NBRC 100088 / M29) TaxID=1242864 RepID=S9P172_CYSF2|nr:hypothetical protein D187_007317 [Cystobacter fuscus DSM 2262]
MEADELRALLEGLAGGALLSEEVRAVLSELRTRYQVAVSPSLESNLLTRCGPVSDGSPLAELRTSHLLEAMALVAVRIIERAQRALFDVEPFSEVHFNFSAEAKVALRLGWEAMAKHGRFPLPPQGARRLSRMWEMPCGAMHFVSASDGDAGYYFTMGIAQSPEAQALRDLGLVPYGLDGELIVPGQAVAPIPPFLGMATRLFASSLATSSNISEDIQSIPYSSFAHPEIMDVAPIRGYLFRPRHATAARLQDAQEEVRAQLTRYRAFVAQTTPTDREFLPDVGAAIDVSGLAEADLDGFIQAVLQPFSPAEREQIALYLLLEMDPGNAEATQTQFKETPRVIATRKAIDAAQRAGLRFVAVADQNEDEWLPNLLEYFTCSELNHLADYSDARGVILCDGRPIDPVYTAATSAQRIQSVFTTLSVDILKMGMWLALDALSARRVWRELQRTPHIPERMFLMPIGILEPYSGFVDNRNRGKSPRAILDPFEKIRFMIEEAQVLGMPSLLTDTRHKSRWVLLGSVDGDLKPHVRESLGAIPLLGREKFMEAERLARRAGILLGQAGSIEAEQIFWIISDTTYDAAREQRNPATSFWTAETERVLRTSTGEDLRGDLQAQRRAAILPYLALVNRTYESHARMDGWLRYLQSIGQGDEELRLELLRQKASLDESQNQYLARQKDGTPADYERAWELFRTAFCAYHARLKKHFLAVRNQVAEAWWAAKRPGPGVEEPWVHSRPGWSGVTSPGAPH